ncbi:MAG: type III pantothenate kinase, partial [Thermodesulfobacteria bacterium]|nr:type III pantothenate kinase [Thermodesulfobacteriota bacterium]
EIGTDRLINSIAAFSRFKSACIVVDFGTATTFDCISQKGEYLGGAIAPGIGMSLQGLFSKTSRLPLVRLEGRDLPALGKTTEDAIRSGILYGFAGMTDRLLEELSGYFEDSSPVTVATGGLASVIFGVSKNLSELLPELTMEGLGICIEKSFLSK